VITIKEISLDLILFKEPVDLRG